MTHITFGGETKTITLDSETPATNRVVQRLNLSGTGITNTLLLTGTMLEVRSTLEMRAGSVLRIVESTLRLPSAGSSFDVNAGEVWLSSGAIDAVDIDARIGRDGGLAMMRVDDGTVQVNELLLGRRVSQSGAQGILLLSGGTLEIGGNLDVGADTNCEGQIVVLGGEIAATSTNFSTAIGEQGDGMMMISNGVVRLDEVDLGRHPNVTGTLYTAGGNTWMKDLTLGRFPLSIGMVFHSAGDLAVDDSLRVGQDGRGELTISGGTLQADTILVAGATNTSSGLLLLQGGTTLVRSGLMMGTMVSTGEIVLAGGVLAITNETSSATWTAWQGTATLGGSSVIVDRLELTASAGRLDFRYGHLSTAGTVVSNGLPFVVGDGTNAATLHLRGGTHTFEDGLVISTNAMLTGCGVIIGTIDNRGTIATNLCLVAPTLVSPVHFNNGFTFSFDSELGPVYAVEYKDTLDATLWNELRTTNGTGEPITITDGPLTPGNRFYRVRVE